jgi:DNA-binding NarL/FixJ family response regulator
MKQTIILIDDDHGPMEYYVKALRMRGFDVRQIDSTDEAFEWLSDMEGKPPDIVVVDMMMPPGKRLTQEETVFGLKSGVFIAKAIREKYSNLILVALTNHNDPNVIEELPTGTKCRPKFEISPFGFADFIGVILSDL